MGSYSRGSTKAREKKGSHTLEGPRTQLSKKKEAQTHTGMGGGGKTCKILKITRMPPSLCCYGTCCDEKTRR
jgi:hypothetical protein